MVKIINVLLICVLSLLLLSCTENPLTNVADRTTQSTSSKDAITFIPLPASTSLKKDGVVCDSEMISATKGGTLSVNFNYQSTNGNVSIKATLTIPGGAILTDQVLKMTLDEQTLSGSVDFTFGPHGTTFFSPALLNIDAKGLDLSSVPSNANVQLYYFNPATNNYELMDAKKETCNLKNGMIDCKDGQLPHFSRYAFGYVH